MTALLPQIEFSKDVYFPGEEVTGRAWISTKKDLTARSVNITFTGKTVTAWKGKKPVGSSPNAKKAKDIHLQMSHEVWEPENEKNVFPSGDYEWNFSFELPKECPASFEGAYGFIRYSVLVQIDVPNSKNKNKVEGAVTVSPIVNLNAIEGSDKQVRKQVEQQTQLCGCLPLNCGPFKKGTVLFTVLLPKLGYVSGETIAVSGLVENHAAKAVKAIEGSLVRIVTYRVAGKGKQGPDTKSNCKKVVETLRMDKLECQVPSGLSKEFSFALVIPPIVATIKNSQFLTVEYAVRITAKIGPCANPAADANVIIGNVPMEGHGQPVQSFARISPAQCWTSYQKPAFVPQVPYYGSG